MNEKNYLKSTKVLSMIISSFGVMPHSCKSEIFFIVCKYYVSDKYEFNLC